MKFSVARMIRQPLSVIKAMYQVTKKVELVPMTVSVNKDVDKAKEDDYVVVGSIAFPYATWKMIQPSLFKVDYTYKNERKYWYLKNDSIYMTVITRDEMIAMQVAKRLDDAA